MQENSMKDGQSAKTDSTDGFFRKTKSNNFFAEDDSLDKIEPFTEEDDLRRGDQML